MMHHPWTDQVCRRLKTAVQWPDHSVQRHLTSLCIPNLLNAITHMCMCKMIKNNTQARDFALYMHWQGVYIVKEGCAVAWSRRAASPHKHPPPDLLDAATYLKCNMLKKGVRTCDDASYMHWPFLWYTFLNICDDRKANILHSLHWTNQWLCVSKRTNMNQDSWNCTCLKEWCTVKSDMIQMTWNQVRIYSLLLSVLWDNIWSI